MPNNGKLIEGKSNINKYFKDTYKKPDDPNKVYPYVRGQLASLKKNPQQAKRLQKAGEYIMKSAVVTLPNNPFLPVSQNPQVARAIQQYMSQGMQGPGSMGNVTEGGMEVAMRAPGKVFGGGWKYGVKPMAHFMKHPISGVIQPMSYLHKAPGITGQLMRAHYQAGTMNPLVPQAVQRMGSRVATGGRALKGLAGRAAGAAWRAPTNLALRAFGRAPLQAATKSMLPAVVGQGAARSAGGAMPFINYALEPIFDLVGGGYKDPMGMLGSYFSHDAAMGLGKEHAAAGRRRLQGGIGSKLTGTATNALMGAFSPIKSMTSPLMAYQSSKKYGDLEKGTARMAELAKHYAKR